MGGAVLGAVSRTGLVRGQTGPFGVPRVSLPDVPDGEAITGIGGAWATLLSSSTLLGVSPEGRISGELALSWAFSDDRQRIDLRLRPDAFFSDGVQITARDVVASAESARERDQGTGDAWRWEHVGAVEAIAGDTVRISLTAPDAAIPALLASYRTPVLPASWLANGWDREEGPFPPASGGFRLQSALEGRLRFIRNDLFYQVGRPRLAGVLCNAPAQGVPRTTELVTNGADLLVDVPLLDVPMLREDPGITLVGGPTNRLCLLAVNLRSPLMADVRLRRLVAGAIDREALVRGAAADEAVPASTLIPPDHWAGLDDTIETIDAEETRAGLAALGLPPGIELRLVASDTDASLANACVLLQEQLALAGIALSLDLLDDAEMEAEMAGGRWDLVMHYTAHWRDPHEAIRPLVVSDGTWNGGGYVNTRVDYLAGLARRASDTTYRAGFYGTIQRIVMNDVPVIPLLFPNYYDAMADRLRDYPFFPPISAAAMRQATMTRPDPIVFP